MGNRDGPHDFVLQVKDDGAVLFRGHEFHEVHNVLPVELGGLAGQTVRQVGKADDGHAVVGYHHFPGLGQFAVAARHVHDDRTGLHAPHRFCSEQQRGGTARNLGGSNDDVRSGRLFRIEFQGRFGLVLVHFLGVAVRGFLSGSGNLHELGSHGFHLFSRGGTHIGGLDDGTHRVRGADSRQTGDTSADNVNLSRRHLAGGRDLTGEQAPESVSGLDNRAVTSDVCHRGQHVHRLSAGNARHGVHRNRGHVTLGEHFGDFGVDTHPQARNQHGAFTQLVNFVFRRGVQSRDNVCLPNFLRSHHFGTGIAIKLVRVRCIGASSGFDDYLIAQLNQFANGVRCGGYQFLPLSGLSRYSYTHV